MKCVDNQNRYSERLNEVLSRFSRPLTAHQLVKEEELSLASASRLLRTLTERGLAECANPGARRSRVYQLTKHGRALQREIRKQARLPPLVEPSEDLDFDLYGWICYRHRSAVLTALDEPLQPAAIKRKAHHADPTLKMSANNVRDVIYRFVEKGIAQPVTQRGKSHLRYELTSQGRALRGLLLNDPNERPCPEDDPR